jgi:hypothetical protein
MDRRLLVWVIGGVLLVGATGGLIARAKGRLIATAEQRRGSVFIAGDQPVTEDQIRQKMQSEGWSNVQIARGSRYFVAIGSGDGQTRRITIDSQTGRRGGDDDDDA